MGIGKPIGDRKGIELSTETNSRSKKVKRQTKKSSSSAMVQKLFNTCKEVFASAESGVIPPAADVDRLRSVLDNMTAEDVGLSPEMPYFMSAKSKGAPIVYLHLYECNRFSMGIFCLPPSAIIPLHNHPGMTVFSKLLFGTMHIKSYDWVVDGASSAAVDNSPSNPVPAGVRLAKVNINADSKAPCNTSILYPTCGGNMHCFTAKTACAVLDVLGPPYSDPDGRHCTYYLEYPFSEFTDAGVSVLEEEKEHLWWLQEREDKPEELTVMGAPYRGPKVMG